MKLTPAGKILKKLDMTALTLAEVLSLSHVTVYKWTYGRDKGGTGGYIPPKYHKKIMAIAKKMKVKLEPSDFLAL